jgi:cytochrome oxidase Cu insertion factor (SCO1/SenC/PrrC family)
LRLIGHSLCRPIYLLSMLGVVVGFIAMGVTTFMLRAAEKEPVFHSTVIDPPIAASEFELLNHRGESFSLMKAPQKLVVLTFLNTSCIDVCPFIGLKLRKVSEMLGEEADLVVFVAVSTDPERDNLERARRYNQFLHPDWRWHYLVGERDQLALVWRDYYLGDPVVTESHHGMVPEEVLVESGLLLGLDSTHLDLARKAIDRFGGEYHVAHSYPVWVIDSNRDIRLKMGQDLAPYDLWQDLRLLLK